MSAEPSSSEVPFNEGASAVNSALHPFLFEGEFVVRTVLIDGSPWFVAADVCRILGIKNAAQALESLDDDEKGISNTYTLGGPQQLLIIAESGLYALIFRSRKPAAVRFRKWVTAEVLPALRRDGVYRMAAPEFEGGPEKVVAAPSETVGLKLVSECRLTYGIQAAQQMWLKQGLPTVPAMFEQPVQPDLFAMAGRYPTNLAQETAR
jgi:prophage antirepressor-like protein